MKSILFENQDLGYKEFHQKLVPNLDPDTIIGVRVPALRKLAKDFSGTEKRAEFLKTLPHKYYEENNLHAFFIEQIADFDRCIAEINRFLPYIDNWATCDSMRPKVFLKNKEKLLLQIDKWLKSEKTYTVRYGIEMLMVHFLDEDFSEKHLEKVASIKSDEYYVNMMLAWYFATALAKQWDKTVPYLHEHKLHPWVHNKTIQKAVESYRISAEQKKFLRNLRRKK